MHRELLCERRDLRDHGDRHGHRFVHRGIRTVEGERIVSADTALGRIRPREKRSVERRVRAARHARLDGQAHGRLPLEVRVHAHGIAAVLHLQPQLFAGRWRPFEVLTVTRVDGVGAFGDAACERGEILARCDGEPDGGELAWHNVDCSGPRPGGLGIAEITRAPET